ncbi:MAG TPA: ABC transporter permease [Micromonosporaceae bacterium]
MARDAVQVLRRLFRWEAALVVLLILTFVYGRSESPNFGGTTDIFFIGLNIGEIAIMALPLALIVITGEIDLSVASMLGLSSSLLGYLYEHKWSIWTSMVIVLIVGAAGGALNGYLVTKLGLPSIAVTIGTLTLFRGIAEIVLGSSSVVGFPLKFTNIGILPLPHTHIAYSAGIFIVMALIFGVVLHATPVGRAIYAIGLQPEAAFFAGIRVLRIKFWLYVLSGTICAFTGILWTFKVSTSRFDAGTGLELNVVAIVLLGGVSIFGGRGSILGVVLAAAVLASFDDALTLVNVSAQVQNIVTGGLLLVSVVVPNGPEVARRLRRRMRGRAAPPPAASLTAGSGGPTQHPPPVSVPAQPSPAPLSAAEGEDANLP